MPLRQRVLILDDEAVVGRALQRLLQSQCEVLVLVQGREALAQVASGRRFDAILCDLMMPEMSGPRFYEELSRLAPEQAQRVIFMTGGAFTDQSAPSWPAPACPASTSPSSSNGCARCWRRCPSKTRAAEIPPPGRRERACGAWRPSLVVDYK